MHIEALQAVERLWSRLTDEHAELAEPMTGLDVGGRNVNGSARHFMPNVSWHGLDIRPGPDVDYVDDAADWTGSGFKYDIVMSTELFEHAARWRDIIKTMWMSLDPTGPGVFISTCASTGRGPHGASGEWGVPAGEWYGNVAPDDLRVELSRYFEVVYVEYNHTPGDAYAYARQPRTEAL